MRRFMRWDKIKPVCHHAHLDKSLTVTQDNLQQSLTHMKEKWILMRDIKQTYTQDDLYNRMNQSVTRIVSQGCRHIRSFIDVDSIVGMECIHVAAKVREEWKNKGVTIQLATQPLEGFISENNIRLFEEAADIVDVIGCLPGRDISPEAHLDIAFSTAKKLQKPVEAHLDQCNIPQERETELFCDFVERYEYQGKARGVHMISLACQPLLYQQDIARRLNDLDIGLITCPSAGISMTQHSEVESPIHNSLAPLQVLLQEGVSVGLGIDNIEDIFMPYCDGDIEFETRLIAESQRIYDPIVLENIVTNTMGFER